MRLHNTTTTNSNAPTHAHAHTTGRRTAAANRCHQCHKMKLKVYTRTNCLQAVKCTETVGGSFVTQPNRLRNVTVTIPHNSSFFLFLLHQEYERYSHNSHLPHSLRYADVYLQFVSHVNDIIWTAPRRMRANTRWNINVSLRASYCRRGHTHVSCPSAVRRKPPIRIQHAPASP